MSRIEELIEERKRKLARLREDGVDPYPARVPRGVPIAEARDRFAALAKTRRPVTVNGRVMAIRKQGGLIFLDVRDGSGRMQALLKRDDVKNFALLKEALELGDFISVTGSLFITKTKEKTIDAKKAEVIVKSLRPLPAEWYGLKDVEERYRRRYLDLLMNEEAARPLWLRSRATRALREILEHEGFVEVETPVLQAVAGGATARPFTTHSHALDMPLYLRVAPELFLKRLLVAGWEKVFEIAKVFRNEGVDREHNPEFTMLELYWAYQDYGGMMTFVEKTVRALARELGIKKLTFGGKAISLKGPWPRVPFDTLIKKHTGIDLALASREDLAAYLKKGNYIFDERLPKYDLADEIFKKAIRPGMMNPVFVIDHPKAISPLAKAHPNDKEKTERFHLLLAGMEVVNGFSELNDAVDQRERMELQEALLVTGQEEVSRLDEDFIEALEYGMPPASGIGIGMDRLVAILSDTPAIRDVIAFPLMKPKSPEHENMKAQEQGRNPSS